jgi:hypothetical protein
MVVQMERIRQLAEEVLTFQEPSGHCDRWLWDRACRIARYTEAICKFPEIQDKGESVDLFCLLTAVYFSDAGIKLYTKAKGVSFNSAALELRGRELRDFSIQILKEKESEPLLAGKMDRICRILTESENRTTRLTEAQILSDARGLDDIGALGLLADVRRCVVQGKGAGALLEGWDRKIEYRYWEARLKEGFHFRTIRQIAQRRFAAMEQCIRQLRTEYMAADLQNIPLESINSIS